MKVCTDSCLFGAWVAKEISINSTDNNALDIGTGTGLLSLIIHQQNLNLAIDAIEIDINAATQAKENILLVNKGLLIKVWNTSLQKFNPPQPYSAIFCNPPFYEQNLQSPDEKRNTALHSSLLSHIQLLNFTSAHLKEAGSFFVLLPFENHENFIAKAETNHLYLTQKINVKQTARHNYFRVMMEFKKKPTTIKELSIAIKENESYTTDFTTLLKDYYLHL